MKKNKLTLLNLVTLVLVILSTSCLTNNKIASFQHIQKDSDEKLKYSNDIYLFESTDLLQILLSNLDEKDQVQINTHNTNGTYKIDNQGMIDFPLVGKIKVVGISKDILKLKIEELLIENKIAKKPLATIKILNFHVTILGEVNKPGLINLTDEQITLPEILGLSGDFTVFAKRNNILLIREQNGKRTFKRFSINNSVTFDPYFYNLRNRDIIYVEPNGIKAFNASQSRSILGFTTGVLTLVILIMTYTR